VEREHVGRRDEGGAVERERGADADVEIGLLVVRQQVHRQRLGVLDAGELVLGDHHLEHRRLEVGDAWRRGSR